MTKHDPERTNPRSAERRATPRPGRPAEDAEREPADHLGAVENDVEETTPPMRGPGDLTGETDSDDDIDPTEELTPG